MGRCCQCKRSFYDLKLHLDLDHSNKSEKWCKHCGRLFSKKSHLKKHLNAIECDTAGHRCYVCGDKDFNSVDSFSCHLETHDCLHVYACKDCKRTFMLRNNYNEHVSLVHDNVIVSVHKLLKDDVNCTSGEKDSAMILNSIQIEEGSDDYCIKCHRCFPQIKIHQAVAHHDKPQIVCHLCGRQFVKVKHFESHLTEHRQNTVKCHVCKKNDFVDFKAFSRHLEEHEYLHVLPCSLCPKVFSLKLNLDKHLRKKHKDFQSVDIKSECTVLNETNHIKESYLPHRSYCRIQFVDSNNFQENPDSPKRKKRASESNFTTVTVNEPVNISGHPSLSCEVNEQPNYIYDKKKLKQPLIREMSPSPIRRRKYSSLSFDKEDENPHLLSESSAKEESSIQTKKKKKIKKEKSNQSSDNVISLLESDKESLSLIKKNKRNKEDSSSQMRTISSGVLSLDSDKEESLNFVKKNKINKSGKKICSSILEMNGRKQDNEESSLVSTREKKSFNEFSRGKFRGENSDDKSFESRKLSESKQSLNKQQKATEQISRLSLISDSENKGDCLSDSSQSSEVDKTCFECGVKFPKMNQAHMHYVSAHNHLSMSCRKCGKEYQTHFNVYCHAMKHRNAYPWQCKRCDVKLKTKKYYLRHMRSVHARKKTYKCPHCDEEFIYHSPFIAHVVLHSEESKFKCSHCKEPFRYKKLIKPHQEQIDCKECDITFPCKTLFKQHLEDKHRLDSLFPCPHCDSRYKMRNVLKRHITNKHFDLMKKDPVYCKFCAYYTHCKYNLSRHVKTNHQ